MGRLLAKSSRWWAGVMQKRQPGNPDNPFLKGIFSPVAGEQESHDLTVTGKIPPALEGMLARIGPNPVNGIENPAAYHWFLGDGMVHGVTLKGGKAEWYAARYVGVDDVNKALGRPIAPGKRRGIADMVNTNVMGHAGSIWALVEAGSYPVEMDIDLNTRRHGLFNSQESLPFTAHPHRDPDSGELHAVCYDALRRSRVHYLVIDENGNLRRNVKIPVKDGPMMHDSAITRSRVVILDLPITFSFKLGISGASFPYCWNPRHQARIGLLPREAPAEAIHWIPVDPCYIFHVSNAYDTEDGKVVLDAVVYNRMFDRSRQGPELDQESNFERWVLDPNSDQVDRKVISSEPQEFPRINEERTGRPYRFSYTVGATYADQLQSNYLMKHDLEKEETAYHDVGPDHVAGEAVFVPRANATNEEDGWVMYYAHRLDCGNSSLVILDAAHIDAEPVATVELPVRVPLGFHCNWITVDKKSPR